MTNSNFGGKLNLMILQRLINTKKERRERVKKGDLMAEQVKKVLSDGDQKLILMVRG